MDKKKEFVDRVKVEGITASEYVESFPKAKPAIGEIADGYKSFVEALGGGFLDIVEKYYESILIAEKNEIIGDTKLKARIKDFSSSNTNTNKKELDDVFGMEIVTSTELEKEVLILFNYLMFDINKDKKYNKPNGYVAYHCMGDYSPKDLNVKDEIIKIVKNTKTEEYKKSSSDPDYTDKREMVLVFPNLSKYIDDSQNLEELTSAFEQMLENLKDFKIDQAGIPLIEFHFITREIEQEAIRGKASHSNYKKINTKLIEDYFMNGRLIRGINAPWKFISDGKNMRLQDFYDTLLDDNTFLRDEIVEKRRLGKEEKEEDVVAKFDKLTATIFPFLRRFLDKNYTYSNDKKDENWGLLKAIIIANRIDHTGKNMKSIEDGLIDYLDQKD